MKKRWVLFIKVIVVILIFWLSDFILHSVGVGESKFYFISKFLNVTIFALMWFFIFYSRKYWKKIAYSIIFSIWITFYYLISAYSGIVQYLGIHALYAPPPFVIFGVFLPPFIWSLTHGLGFYLGLEVSDIIKKK
jgi:hypothetical protein